MEGRGGGEEQGVADSKKTVYTKNDFWVVQTQIVGWGGGGWGGLNSA
jgi:hypothetical protein